MKTAGILSFIEDESTIPEGAYQANCDWCEGSTCDSPGGCQVEG